ncbi:diketogulonate reductase-like aldo/keto reductase [Paraburkholderia bannensis]|uniref:Diketogulonate reductase-like aldo/keto reductase n=1 Tax=Paraburkholderia bannensis TaxID=765414 RepID=A0A7W9U258_9BURK|nr:MULTISPECIES: aldo/keto reductase [Paraburkholderia]MBB3259758.1 diketogulonate reductase-like aldo/keto reductase [Paraburkholderia sp. WP4_3_2]MBB6104931.1 diketogulonate reductase-like aldo/keto reductase [Paraburkholderia bannensis]
MVTGKSPVYRLNKGIETPAFGLGVFRSEPEKTVAAVRSAVANGYRLIDTAAAYMNEQQVGEGIRSSGVPWEDVFVTTEVWITDNGYDHAGLPRTSISSTSHSRRKKFRQSARPTPATEADRTRNR